MSNSKEIIPENSWENKLVLCMEGGGARGYASLLMLRKLMQTIQKQEESINEHSSFGNPLDTEDMPTETNNPHRVPRELLKQEGVYLPCHYFDYIGGTSTGGLNALMLGRLRMSADECISEYPKLVENIFRRRRHSMKGLWRSRYNCQALEEETKRIIQKGIPSKARPEWTLLESPDDLCRAIVVAKQHSPDGSSEDPYLFRTYLQGGDPLEVLNPGEGHNCEIWEAARATSAAPGYFKPITINGSKYSDGGVNYNDPTAVVHLDINQKENASSVSSKRDLVLTIGTGLHPKTRDRAKNILFQPKSISKIHDLFSRIRNALVDGDTGRRQMRDAARIGGFIYYKWDGGEVIGRTKLDVWQPMELNRMEQEVERFMGRPEIEEELQICAKLLVQKRRARVDGNPDRWRRWAYCTQIRCPYCNQNRHPSTREEAKEHILDKHLHRLPMAQRQDLDGYVQTLSTIWAWGRGPFHYDGQY